MYDQLLKARIEVLSDLSEELNDAEFVVSQKAIDRFIDRLEGKHVIEETFFRPIEEVFISIQKK